MKARILFFAAALAAALGAGAVPVDVNLVLNSTGFGAPAGGGGTFAGILREGAGAPTTGVILLHGRGLHPDSHVVGPLRVSLNDLGYTTLSIALPVPPDTTGNGVPTDFQDYVNDVTGPNVMFPELYARVRAAEHEVAAHGVQKVVLIGFSLGSRMSAAYLARGAAGDLPIISYVGVGMYADSLDPLNTALTLDEIGIPVLDIYGSLDTRGVTGATARAAAYASPPAGPSYTQIAVPQTGPLSEDDAHQFDNIAQPEAKVNEAQMVLQVGNWVRQFAPLAVPAPGSFALLALGMALVAIVRRQARRQEVVTSTLTSGVATATLP